MKIKAVCEATGLTDRTVRYYIEEGLIAPFYTENYCISTKKFGRLHGNFPRSLLFIYPIFYFDSSSCAGSWHRVILARRYCSGISSRGILRGTAVVPASFAVS